MIFRDDDFSHLSQLNEFRHVHEVFAWYGQVHTIAVMAKNLERNKELIDYVKSQDNIDVQLHCWEHLDYSNNEGYCFEHLKMGANKIEEVFGKRPTVWYPTFNRVSPVCIAHAHFLGMETSYHKRGLLSYVEKKGIVDEKVLNFHYWAYSDLMFLEPALRIAKELEGK